jgi:hypothetical protein
MMTSSLGILGCVLTRPPREVVETKYVIIHPGKPYQILEIKKKTAVVRTLDEPQEVAEIPLDKLTGNVNHDVEHWRKVKKVLDWYANYRKGMIKGLPDASEKPKAAPNDVRRPGT